MKTIILKVNIRRAKKTDLAAICQNENKSYQYPWSDNILEESINGRYHCFVMLLNNKIIGHLICQFILDEVHLYNVCVLPKYQKKGLGQQWLEYLNQFSLEVKAKYILLEVRESNITAKRLYEKMTYKEIGYRKNYYSSNGHYENALVMKAKVI